MEAKDTTQGGDSGGRAGEDAQFRREKRFGTTPVLLKLVYYMGGIWRKVYHCKRGHSPIASSRPPLSECNGVAFYLFLTFIFPL
jgi:hypothetical protein